MSWVEKIENGIIIQTGDGKIFEPFYILAEKSVDYNIAEFDFVNIEGTLVTRTKPRGRRYKFEFHFQGDDHLDQSEAFEISAKDPRPWIVSHPFYGRLTLQPTGLTIDPTGLSTSKITCDLIETISENFPRTSVDPRDSTALAVAEFVEDNILNYSDNVIPETSDINQLRNDANTVFALGAESVKSGDQSNEYFQIFNKAIIAINNAAADASLAATEISNLMIFPALFASQVSERLSLLLSQFNALSEGIAELLTPNAKTTYEMNAGSVISTMVDASVNPLANEYENANDVLDVIDVIIPTYNTFIDTLNDLQSNNGGSTDSYIPNFESVSSLTTAVNFSVSNLLAIALTASQERSLILEKDSNSIILAHRFYGLEEDDSTITRFNNENGIDLNTILQIKAGTKVLYYI